MGKYYVHSGGLNPAAALIALLVGAVSAALLSVAYAYVVIYLPEIHLAAFVCVGFGMLLGCVPGCILLAMKVRNTPVTMLVVGLVALVGLSGSWVAWEVAVLSRGGANPPPMWKLVGRPDVVYHIAARVNEVGTWTIGSAGSSGRSGNTSGFLLAMIWLVEALTIVGGALLVGWGMIGSKPFCEACDRWCDDPVTVRSTGVADATLLRQKLEAGDFAAVNTFGPATADRALVFEVHTCRGCKRLNTLTVSRRAIVRDKKGRVRRTDKKVLVRKLLVTPADLAKLASPAQVVA